MTKIKIEIKNRRTGKILFEYEKENNTIKDTLLEAIKSSADLSGAYLRGADLRGAENLPYIPFACPSDGAFIGWKKVDGKLVKLLIRREPLERVQPRHPLLYQ